MRVRAGEPARSIGLCAEDVVERREMVVARALDGLRVVADDDRIDADLGLRKDDAEFHDAVLLVLKSSRTCCETSTLSRVYRWATGACTAPSRSRCAATRSAVCSAQGAAMICTPIGIAPRQTGTATTGSPMNEIGCV